MAEMVDAREMFKTPQESPPIEPSGPREIALQIAGENLVLRRPGLRKIRQMAGAISGVVEELRRIDSVLLKADFWDKERSVGRIATDLLAANFTPVLSVLLERDQDWIDLNVGISELIEICAALLRLMEVDRLRRNFTLLAGAVQGVIPGISGQSG